MTNGFQKIFGTSKPVIAMVHLSATPGSPLYDTELGINGIVANAEHDLESLRYAGVDAVMFGNENDRPYELQVDPASTAAMAYIIGKLAKSIDLPFGVNVLWDPMATVALAVATGAAFIREIFTGYYASDMGNWSPNAAEAIRYRNRLGGNDIKVFYNISAEFAYSLDRRSLADRARSVVFSSIPDAVLVSGPITGQPVPLSELAEVKKAVSDIPVLANTGVTQGTVGEVFSIADGVIVGTALKENGNTWNRVDPERARNFMVHARKARKK